MLARELMTVRPQCVTPDDSLSAAAELMRELDVGIVPVVEYRDGKRLVGLITDRDIAIRCIAGHHEVGCLVRDHMTGHGLHTLHPDADVADVIALMEREHVCRVPVVSDDGELVGIIGQADLAAKLGPRRPLDMDHIRQAHPRALSVRPSTTVAPPAPFAPLSTRNVP